MNSLVQTLQDHTGLHHVRKVEVQLKKLSRAVEYSPSSIVVTDKSGRIEYVNPKFTKITGYTYDEAIGQNPRIMKSGKQSAELYKELWSTIASGKEWRGELCNKRKNGQLYWESVSISSITNESGQIVNYVAVKEDISERKKMEETIRLHNEKLETLVEERTTHIMELERQRMEYEKLAASGRMAATVAHEINNPLSAVKGGFLLIKDSIPKDSKYYSYVDVIDKEMDRIARIVKQMFNFNKPYQGKISCFDSIVSIREVVSMLKGLGHESGVMIDFNCSDDLIEVSMSQDYFKQVLYNIIKNAIEASGEGKRVEINTKVNSDRLIVMISDLGEGMSDEVCSKIFEPFFTTKDKYADSGLGLGLATTKVIVETMGGSIDCISEKGKGTAFTLDLPLHLIKY